MALITGAGGGRFPSLKTKIMFSDEFIKKAKEMADNNSHIIGIYFSLPAADREIFKERFERVVKRSHDIIKHVNDDQLRTIPV